MDAVGTLALPGLEGPVEVGENLLHLEDSFESAARYRFVKRLPRPWFLKCVPEPFTGTDAYDVQAVCPRIVIKHSF
jgi:hypothetical protein